MTTKRRILTKCPKWSDDREERHKAEFRSAVKQTYQTVSRHARTGIADCDNVRIWHLAMFKSVVPLNYYAGNFRQDDSKRPCLRVQVAVGSISALRFQEVVEAMDDLMTELRQHIVNLEIRWQERTPDQRALFLAQVMGWLLGNFIRIHPFVNGNGRTSRLIWAWTLLRFNLPVQCRIGLRPEPPYESLMASAMSGDDAPLANFVLQNMANTPSQKS